MLAKVQKKYDYSKYRIRPILKFSNLSIFIILVIIFFSHPVKLGESITIIDKDFDIKGQVSDIGLFYVILKTDTTEKITIPNNVFLQKATKINLWKQKP